MSRRFATGRQSGRRQTLSISSSLLNYSPRNVYLVRLIVASLQSLIEIRGSLMIERTTRRVRDFYNLFTSGLTVQEIERLVNVETRDTYAYYLRHVKPEKQQQGSIKRFVLLCWNLFLAFLLKLTPARRLFYAVAIFGLGYAFYRGELAYALYSFLIMNFL